MALFQGFSWSLGFREVRVLVERRTKKQLFLSRLELAVVAEREESAWVPLNFESRFMGVADRIEVWA